MTEIDRCWRDAHPLPAPDGETSKNSRGKLLVIGGARRMPGAIRLTGEAALRVGAGRVRLATLEALTALLGVAFPEAGVVGLPEQEGELTPGPQGLLAGQAAHHDAVIVGPAMADKDAAARVIEALCDAPPNETALVLDAAAVAAAGRLNRVLSVFAGRLVFTPHQGEMAALTGRDEKAVIADGAALALEVAARFGAVVALKGTETLIATPGGELLHYPGGGVGLATAGSGDVLAGVVGGLLARGADPLLAAGWGVWLHGEAGRACARRIAPVGFLARDLLPELPGLLPAPD